MPPIALSARQRADTRLLIGALEVEAGRVLARVHDPVADLQLIQAVGYLLPDGLALIQRIARLVDVGELNAVAQLERALVGRFLAGDHAKQRRLARPVGSDDTDDAGAWQIEAEVLDQQLLAEPLAQVVRR